MAGERWRGQEPTALVGRHEGMTGMLEKAARFARVEAPVLITGETGTGKELVARAVYLLSERKNKPFVRVNCAQYRDDPLLASELFGHKRGSFTGAVRDRRGMFEEGDGGVVFLDEIGELSLGAQAMLLRTIGEGEVTPVGAATARRVNVRVIAATNRDLAAMVEAGQFREDLYFRLSFLQLQVIPLRERGGDWKLMLDHYLHALNARSQQRARFCDRALELLGNYDWPGNVRELKGLVEMSHCLCDDDGVIDAHLLGDRVSGSRMPAAWRAAPPAPVAAAASAVAPLPRPRAFGPSARHPAAAFLARIGEGEGTFWSLVYEPFLGRDLNRAEVQEIVAEGLRRSNWSYKRALEVFGVEQGQYLKFMDFLRHHRLKPER